MSHAADAIDAMHRWIPDIDKRDHDSATRVVLYQVARELVDQRKRHEILGQQLTDLANHTWRGNVVQRLEQLENTVRRLDLTLEEHVGTLDHTKQQTHADLGTELSAIRTAIDDLIHAAAGFDAALADQRAGSGRAVQRHIEEHHMHDD